jgi:hypothetical protein
MRMGLCYAGYQSNKILFMHKAGNFKKPGLIIILFAIFFNQSYATKILASSFGYSPTNSSRAFMNAILSTNDTIVFDKQINDWLIEPAIFNGLKNRTLIFKRGVVLRVIPGTDLDTAACLTRFNHCSNITIIGYGASFSMNKATYLKLNNSEYRHALSLVNCSGITIKGLILKDSGGDGICLDGEFNKDSKKNYCENIVVEDVQCINNSRQGMSIMSVQNMQVRHSLFSGTKGTLPEAGVDVEPYTPAQRIVNLSFDNCSFTNNNYAGIAVALVFMDSTSMPVSILFTDCYLSHNRDTSNIYPPGEIALNADNFKPVKGEVVFERVFIDGSNWPALFSSNPASAYHTIFKDCVFKDVSRQQVLYNEPIVFEVGDYNKPTGYLGGITFDNVFLSYSTNFNFLKVYGVKFMEGVSAIDGHITVVEPNDSKPFYIDVKDTTKVGFTYNNQKILPGSSISLIVDKSKTSECGEQAASFSAVRRSANIKYPFGVSYNTRGTVYYGDDLHLLTGGMVIPANATAKKQSIIPRKDEFKEPAESIILSLKPGSAEKAGKSAMVNIRIIDCNRAIDNKPEGNLKTNHH